MSVCPLCRGRALVIAIWRYIDHRLITQPVTQGDLSVQVPNEMDIDLDGPSGSRPTTVQIDETPTATRTTQETVSRGTGSWTAVDASTSPRQTTPPQSPLIGPLTSEAFVILGATDEDAQQWAETPVGTVLEAKMYPTTPERTGPNTTQWTQTFHTETRLGDGALGIIIDPGSVGNLAGDEWAIDVALESQENGRRPGQTKRDRPLRVSGVGQGSEMATHNVELPVCLRRLDGTTTSGSFEAPTVRKSALPGLLGLISLTNRRAILDMNTKQLHFVGPGDYDLTALLPPGTESFQLRAAPSGHLLLPCNHYQDFDQQQMAGRLTLDATPVTLLATTSKASSSDAGVKRSRPPSPQ